jgi:hypothetical protein
MLMLHSLMWRRWINQLEELVIQLSPLFSCCSAGQIPPEHLDLHWNVSALVIQQVARHDHKFKSWHVDHPHTLLLRKNRTGLSFTTQPKLRKWWMDTSVDCWPAVGTPGTGAQLLFFEQWGDRRLKRRSPVMVIGDRGVMRNQPTNSSNMSRRPWDADGS